MRIRIDEPAHKFSEDEGPIANSLDRRDLADDLDNLYSSLSDSTVAIMHGRWGTGKSLFAKRWLDRMSANGARVIYFDAFANDYLKEPFDALVSAILRDIATRDGRKSKKYEKFLERAAAVSKRLAATGGKAAVRVVTLNAIDASDVEELTNAAKGLSGDFADLSEAAIKNLLERQAEDAAQFDLFRSAMTELKEGGSRGKRNEGRKSEIDGSAESKIIFLVDELDRCRPDFALGVLECLKHFFRVDGFHFILVTNKDHLQKAVAAKYGLHDSSQEYLQKFFDFTIFFESSSRFREQNRSGLYARRVLAGILGENVTPREKHDLQNAFASFAIAFNMPLREIEHIGANMALAYFAIRENQFRPYILILFLAVLKGKDSALYQKARVGDLSFELVDKFLNQVTWDDSFSVDRLLQLLRFYLDEDVDVDAQEFMGFGSGLSRYGFSSRRDVIPYLANSVMETFGR